MLNIAIPKTHYNTADYPNLEERTDGAVVPIAIGDVHNIIPVCIDTVGQVYQVSGHAIHEVNEVRIPDGVVLAEGVDYTLNAGHNEISLLATPYLAANTTYYFIVEADYAVPAAAYLRLHRKDGYANGQLYTINGAGVWDNSLNTQDLRFKIFGKTTLGGSEAVMVNNGSAPRTSQIGLGDNALRTRIAQSFKTPVAKAFYATRIQIYSRKTGSPTGNVRVSILSAYNPAEVQVGIQSDNKDIGNRAYAGPGAVAFPQRATDSGLIVDIEGAEKTGAPIVDGADALEYLVETVLDKSATLLDPWYLADFKADRTQEVKLWLDKDTTFGKALGKLESTLLFKFVPLLDGTYGTVVYDAAESSTTPHFTDEDYLSFRLRYDWTDLKYKVAVKYDEDAGGKMGWKVEEVTSDLARFFYESEETLEAETFHRTQAGAAWLAGELSSMYEYPPLIVEFEVHGWGLDLIPGRDKVSVTRTRAGYAGAELNDVLFRVIKLVKKPGTSTVVITAQLDTQTY